MARPYRLQGEKCFYHITSRGNDRKKLYISEYDYKKFLEYVLKAKKKYNFFCYAYVLMSNHYHLLIETIQPNLSKIMHYINSVYTTYYNIKRKRCGHLFQGRYKSIVVDKDNYFLELSRYIHLNPVRAKITERPEDYKWSSYKGYISKKSDEYIDKEEIEKHLNMGVGEYREFVSDGIGEKTTIFQNIYGGFLLGKTSFIKDKLADLKEQLEKGDFSYKKEMQRTSTVEDILRVIYKEYGINDELYKQKNRRLREKKTAMYLIKNLTALTNKEIGNIFGLTPSAVTKAAGSIEKLKEEDKAFKKEISRLLSRFKG